MGDNDGLERVLNELLERTTKLSFSFFSKTDAKKKQVLVEKNKIDKCIEEALQKYDSEIDIVDRREKAWEEAQKHAIKEFDNIPEKHKLNSFYLQEVMHVYVENLKRIILGDV